MTEFESKEIKETLANPDLHEKWESTYRKGMNRAYPVETHTHYMLGVHSNARRRRTLDVVGVGDNRIGTE